jgi:hypothetical protein
MPECRTIWHLISRCRKQSGTGMKHHYCCIAGYALFAGYSSHDSHPIRKFIRIPWLTGIWESIGPKHRRGLKVKVHKIKFFFASILKFVLFLY